MLLKVGYRHVYISRKFAQRHGFVPRDAKPGNYGYGGLVNIGTWPITLVTSALARTDADTPEGKSLSRGHAKAGAMGQTHGRGRKSPSSGYQSRSNQAPGVVGRSSIGLLADVDASALFKGEKGTEPTVTNIEVYLAEEVHFDVVLGRSFFEKRQIRTSSIDPTEVVCLDTGEKIECELVILKDGRGEIVTVT